MAPAGSEALDPPHEGLIPAASPGEPTSFGRRTTVAWSLHASTAAAAAAATLAPRRLEKLARESRETGGEEHGRVRIQMLKRFGPRSQTGPIRLTSPPIPPTTAYARSRRAPRGRRAPPPERPRDQTAAGEETVERAAMPRSPRYADPFSPLNMLESQ
jgi:hypothetical protein